MYEKYKSVFDSTRNRYLFIGCVVLLICLCLGYIFYQPSGTDYQRSINAVERAQEQQRESLEFNRRIQHSIDRSTGLSHEAKERIDRSSQYNHEIGKRVDESKNAINEARGYLERNAELFDRVERESRERQSNNQATQDATQPISDGRGGSNHWRGNTSMNER